MSLTTDELNYLVWRYLQETGLEISAFALQDESRVHELDERLKELVPIGSLVNLIQKGILYSEVDSLVERNGAVQDDKFYQEKFSLMHALGADLAVNQPIEATGRFSNDEDKVEQVKLQEPASREESPGFIKVLEQLYSFEPSTISDWNPTSPSVLSYGLTDARAKILVILDKLQTIKIDHAQEFNSFTNDYSSDITMISWSTLGNLLITGIQYGELRLWQADGTLKSTLDFHNAPIVKIKWSPSSNHVISMDADNSIALWDINTQQVLQNFNFGKNESNELLGLDCEWLDNEKFIIPGLNSTAILFQINDRNPIGTLKGHTKPITVINFFKDSSTLLTASDDQTIRIWNGSNFNNSQILIGHSQSITFANWINKDFILSCSLDGSVRIWDIRTGKALFLYVLEGLPIIIADLSKDLNQLAIGTSDGSITILKIDLLIDNKLKPISEYQPSVTENNYITSLKWNKESKMLIVGYNQSETVILKSEL